MVKNMMPKKVYLYFCFMLLLAGLSSYISSTVPSLYSAIVDNGIMTSNQVYIYKMLISILALTAVNGVIRIYNSITINKIGLYVSRELKESTLKKVFDSSYEFFDKVRTGELVQRIKEVDAISGIFNPQLISIIVSAITGILSLIKVVYLDVRIVMIYIIAFFSLLIVSYRFSNKYKMLTYELVGLNAEFSKNVNESITGMNEIKTNNLSSLKRNSISLINKEIYEKTKKQNACYAFNVEIITLINVMTSLSITALYAFLFGDGNLTIGTYIALTQYTSLIMAPAQMASSGISMIQPIIVILKRLSFFDEAVRQNDAGIDLDTINTIRFKKVCFNYDAKEVLDNVSFTIKKNDKVLINGENGAGKTTLVKLLVRLYDNYNGVIELNNMDSKKYSLKSIRRQIAIVFQETFLFDDTLYRNIICGNKNVSREEVIEVIEKVGLVKNLSGMSIDEILNISIVEGGKNLSGGQKRMIAIARALIKKPSVIILDEPTTYLDEQTKNNFCDFIRNIQNVILIIISHDNDLRSLINNTIELKKN
jgi:ABC-type multidrug transport system fused ATPase/permease subunit